MALRTAGADTSLGTALTVGAGALLAVEIGGVVFSEGVGTLVGFPLLLLVGLLVGRGSGAYRIQAEQSVTLHNELPPAATSRTTGRLAGFYDKGTDALIELQSTSVDAATSEPLAESRTTLFVRGEGGFGGERGSSEPWTLPTRPADHVVTYRTRTDQALLYRLSGDRNPLHSDPWLAGKTGFDRPILHGLCTYGFTGRALLHALCDAKPASFGTMSARFSTPVLPGQSLDIHIWDDDGAFKFQTRVGDVTVLDRGVFTKRS